MDALICKSGVRLRWVLACSACVQLFTMAPTVWFEQICPGPFVSPPSGTEACTQLAAICPGQSGVYPPGYKNGSSSSSDICDESLCQWTPSYTPPAVKSGDLHCGYRANGQYYGFVVFVGFPFAFYLVAQFGAGFTLSENSLLASWFSPEQLQSADKTSLGAFDMLHALFVDMFCFICAAWYCFGLVPALAPGFGGFQVVAWRYVVFALASANSIARGWLVWLALRQDQQAAASSLSSSSSLPLPVMDLTPSAATKVVSPPAPAVVVDVGEA